MALYKIRETDTREAIKEATNLTFREKMLREIAISLAQIADELTHLNVYGLVTHDDDY